MKMYRVATIVGANRQVAVNNVMAESFTEYKQRMTNILRNTGVRPTTKITFKVFREDEIVENGIFAEMARLAWTNNGFERVFGCDKVVWTNPIGVEM
jgi:hypothetical protein